MASGRLARSRMVVVAPSRSNDVAWTSQLGQRDGGSAACRRVKKEAWINGPWLRGEDIDDAREAP